VLNEQIARTWVDRGAFPGLGSALEALGMRMGTALALELVASGTVGADDDPWPAVDALLRAANGLGPEARLGGPTVAADAATAWNRTSAPASALAA
jgi:hypothetical protein